MAAHTCQLYPPLFFYRKLEKWSLLSRTACMQQYCTFFFFFLFRTLFILFFLFLFLNFFYFLFFPFFIDSLIENYIFFQPLPSQLMQQNNSFLFIFLMFISFVLLFRFLFLFFFLISLSLCNPWYLFIYSQVHNTYLKINYLFTI